MRYLAILFLLAACATRPSNEMEAISQDVLKAKQGIEIDIKPLPKDVAK
jgi:hypothetical protein